MIVNEFQERIGVGRPSLAFGRLAGTTRSRRITAEEGPNRGGNAGFQTDHWDGRVDAVVRPSTANVTLSRSMTQD